MNHRPNGTPDAASDRPRRKRRLPSKAAAFTVLALVGVLGAGGAVVAAQNAWVEHSADAAWADINVDKWAQVAASQPQVPAISTTRAGDTVSLGPEGGKKTLVLWTTGGEYEPVAETNAIQVAHLATHFGRVTVKPAASYEAGAIRGYDALLFVGSTYESPLPQSLITDVMASSTPILWAGSGLQQVAGQVAPGVLDDVTAESRAAAFRARYGWDAAESSTDAASKFASVTYKGQALPRDAEQVTDGLVVPRIVNPAAVTVLAEAACAAPSGGACTNPQRLAKGTVPWAIRSGNLTFVSEVPFSFALENDRYLAFADLLYDVIAPDTKPIKQAALRLEDVSPNSDPAKIREYADYLSSQGVPFQIATVPNFVDREGVTNAGTPRNITLAEAPQVVEALKYAQSKGATLIQHGTTHQFGRLHNPYNGVTGDDFEFYKALCSTTAAPPFTFIPCETDTHVQFLGPLSEESEEHFVQRILGGRALFEQAGLSAPPIFETPHYMSSPAGYRAMRQVYTTRYERALYADGLLTGKPSTGEVASQIFPYSVTDIYGSKVLPENLGNYSPTSYSGHPVRTPDDILAAAKSNLVVRESTASLFYHPFLPIDGLQKVVTGIKGMGYTFVPAMELR